MTKDEILNMEEGIQLDILIAERVMGACAHYWKIVPREDDDGVCRICQKCHLEFWGLRPPVYGENYDSYSTNISAALDVIVKMENNDYWWTADNIVPNSDPVVYHWRFSKAGKRYDSNYDFSLPLAICHAALLTTIEE